jgi:hypothetical protein
MTQRNSSWPCCCLAYLLPALPSSSGYCLPSPARLHGSFSGGSSSSGRSSLAIRRAGAVARPAAAAASSGSLSDFGRFVLGVVGVPRSESFGTVAGCDRGASCLFWRRRRRFGGRRWRGRDYRRRGSSAHGRLVTAVPPLRAVASPAARASASHVRHAPPSTVMTATSDAAGVRRPGPKDCGSPIGPEPTRVVQVSRATYNAGQRVAFQVGLEQR